MPGTLDGKVALITGGADAEILVWLCSDVASFVTSHTMTVDGGLVAQYRADVAQPPALRDALSASMHSGPDTRLHRAEKSARAMV